MVRRLMNCCDVTPYVRNLLRPADRQACAPPAASHAWKQAAARMQLCYAGVKDITQKK